MKMPKVKWLKHGRLDSAACSSSELVCSLFALLYEDVMNSMVIEIMMFKVTSPLICRSAPPASRTRQ